MAYDPVSAIISAPVSIYDVQQCFGSGRNDVGGLIANVNINKWAKYKPVRSATIDTVTGQWSAALNKWLSSAIWWKTADGKCGLNIDTFNSAGSISISTNFLYKLKNGLLPWNYLRPQGGASSPYRLQDFARYYHDAVPAVGTCGVQDGQVVWVHRTGQATTLQIDYDAPSDDEVNLTLQDFTINSTPMSQFYLGMLLWRENGNYMLVTTSQPMGTGISVSIEVEIGYSDTGNWSMVPFICSQRIQQGGTIPAATYLSAGITTPVSFIVKPDSQTIEYFVSAAWNSANTRISAFTKVVNNLSSTQNVMNVTIYIYTTSSPSTTPDQGGSLVTSRNIGSCTIASGDDYDFSEQLFAVTRNTSLTYWVGATGNGGGVEPGSWMMVEDADEPLQ